MPYDDCHYLLLLRTVPLLQRAILLPFSISLLLLLLPIHSFSNCEFVRRRCIMTMSAGLTSIRFSFCLSLSLSTSSFEVSGSSCLCRVTREKYTHRNFSGRIGDAGNPQVDFTLSIHYLLLAYYFLTNHPIPNINIWYLAIVRSCVCVNFSKWFCSLNFSLS